MACFDTVVKGIVRTMLVKRPLIMMGKSGMRLVPTFRRKLLVLSGTRLRIAVVMRNLVAMVFGRVAETSVVMVVVMSATRLQIVVVIGSLVPMVVGRVGAISVVMVVVVSVIRSRMVVVIQSLVAMAVGIVMAMSVVMVVVIGSRMVCYVCM